MLFNSYIFLFLFLPLSLFGYFFLNHFKKYTLSKLFLTGMSLWFYAYFNLSYFWIILCSILINYICHLKILSYDSTQKKRINFWFYIGIFFNIGLLFYFKYFNFFLDNLNLLFHTSFTLKRILLPLGISFFTFQQLAFIIDTKKGEVPKQTLSNYMLFVSFFPQLIAGPIVSHKEMLPQFEDLSLKKINYNNLYLGFYIFVLGLAKKVLLADIFGLSVNACYNNYQLLSGLSTALIILFFTFQIYFDFSGYCDMARGIGYLFNFQIPINFFSPYKATNILDFWKRWHMTLTRFFTTYLYIPLGGNKKGNLRTYLNIIIVFFVSGIWHGAGFTFIIWGLLHGILNVLTRIFHKFKKRLSILNNENSFLKKLRNLSATILTFAIINITWVFFRANSLSQAFEILSSLFSFNKPPIVDQVAYFFISTEYTYLLKYLKIENHIICNYLPMFFYSVLSIILIWGCKNIKEKESQLNPSILRCVFVSLLFFLCVISLSNVSTFLYFNF